MSAMPRREALLLISIAAVAAAGAALLASPDADVSPLTYLQVLNNRGLVVTDTAAAITTGYTICTALDTQRGDVVAARVYAELEDVDTIDQAAIMVVTSVEELCPWHDHRALVIA